MACYKKPSQKDYDAEVASFPRWEYTRKYSSEFSGRAATTMKGDQMPGRIHTRGNRGFPQAVDSAWRFPAVGEWKLQKITMRRLKLPPAKLLTHGPRETLLHWTGNSLWALQVGGERSGRDLPSAGTWSTLFCGFALSCNWIWMLSVVIRIKSRTWLAVVFHSRKNKPWVALWWKLPTTACPCTFAQVPSHASCQLGTQPTFSSLSVTILSDLPST